MKTTHEVVEKLKKELPDLMDQAQVVGQWLWLEFQSRPAPLTIVKLKKLGFHWNKRRRCWQHPCGTRSTNDPRDNGLYDVRAATALKLKDALPCAESQIAKEFKVISLRECALADEMQVCDEPEKAATYWREHIATDPHFNPECECLAVLLLNTRRRLRGHHLVSIGTMDTILVHPREIFRIAVIGSAAAVLVMHNHPSGDPTPSDSDIKVTRDLIRAGQLMKIDVLDHVVIGLPSEHRPKAWTSLRELGYFAA